MRGIFIKLILVAAELASALGATAIQLDSVAAIRHRAMGAYRHKQLGRAISLYWQAVAMGDSSITPYYNMACCYCRAKRVDSCHYALQLALDRGYMNYAEMSFDYDLQPLQSQPYWNSMYQQATRNADGKIPQKMFYDALMQSLTAADSAALLRLSAPTLRTSLAGPSARHLLSRLDTLRIFSHIASAKELREKAELLTRSLSYENNHFVDCEEYFLQFPIPYFDADMARLLTSADLHFRLHTVDDMYSQLDSVWIEENVAPISQPITALTDTVMALAVHVKGDKAYDYQARLSRNEFRQIDLLLSQSAILSPAEYARMVKTGNLYFLRLASLPMRKQFKGLKIAFYAGSKAAVVVQDNHYCLMRCAGLKWLEEWIKNQMKEEKKK